MNVQPQIKPTADDIRAAIVAAETGDWIDPLDEPIHWYCELFDPEGRNIGNGSALKREIAMAMAWLHAHAPDALIDAYVERDMVPLEIPPGYHFEIVPDGPAVTPHRDDPPVIALSADEHAALIAKANDLRFMLQRAAPDCINLLTTCLLARAFSDPPFTCDLARAGGVEAVVEKAARV